MDSYSNTSSFNYISEDANLDFLKMHYPDQIVLYRAWAKAGSVIGYIYATVFVSYASWPLVSVMVPHIRLFSSYSC